MLKIIQYTCNTPYMLWDNIFFQTWKGNIALPTWAKLFWSKLLKGHCSCIRLFNAHALPLSGHPRNHLGSITYLLKLGKVLHSHIKT
jgi:hypothetical protein